jgi:hypothetical protein
MCIYLYDEAYDEARLVTHIMQVWREDGVPRDVPVHQRIQSLFAIFGSLHGSVGRTVAGCLVVNKDQDNPHKVAVRFEDSVRHRSGGFAGSVAAITFGKAEYQWRPDLDGGTADPTDRPPAATLRPAPGRALSYRPRRLRSFAARWPCEPTERRQGIVPRRVAYGSPESPSAVLHNAALVLPLGRLRRQLRVGFPPDGVQAKHQFSRRSGHLHHDPQ